LPPAEATSSRWSLPATLRRRSSDGSGQDEGDTKTTTTNRSNTHVVESRIPTFNSIEEEAAFWDTHSFEEFADEPEVVNDHTFVAIRYNDVLKVVFKGDALEALDAAAAKAGVGVGALAYPWVLERLGMAPQGG
jgi:hypothetical protein